MGEVQRIIDDDPDTQNGREVTSVTIGRQATFEERWEANRGLAWQ